MKAIERKVFVENLPTQKESQNQKQKSVRRRTFLDDQYYAEKIKQNISMRRNQLKEENHSLLMWKVSKPKKQVLQEINFQNLQNIQKNERNQRQVAQNEQKINKLRKKLQELYQHYQGENKYLGDLKTKVFDTQKLKKQNETLSNQIGKIRNMVKQVLLVREKSKLSL